jgi:flagellar motor switch protein FliM
VDKPGLDAAELAALREAMGSGQAGAGRGGVPDPREVRAVPLIADDRAAEGARPAALRIGMRLASRIRAVILHLTGIKVEVAVLGAETVEAASLRDSLSGTWQRAVEIDGRPGLALFTVGGALVEALCARLLGAPVDASPPATSEGRAPSPAALRVFGRVGDALAGALHHAWREEQGGELRVIDGHDRAESWRRALVDGDLVVALTLEIKHAAPGLVRVVARPDTLVRPRPPMQTVPAPAHAVDEALAQVPVQVLVELGRVKLSLAELGALQVGQLLPLESFVDDLLPVRCAGRIKAWGRALVARGAMAVQITDPSRPAADVATDDGPRKDDAQKDASK